MKKSGNNSRWRVLGNGGEQLIWSLLGKNGFTEIRDLNVEKTNYPFADYFAIKDGQRLAISVKSRNRLEWNGKKENSRYKLGGVEPVVNGVPHCRMLATNVCKELDAIGAWIIVQFGQLHYSAYFGTLDLLDTMPRRNAGPATAILVNPRAIQSYAVLAKDMPHGMKHKEFRNFDECE